MLKLTSFTCEHLEKNCVTDKKKPSFSFSIASDEKDVEVELVELSVNDWNYTTTKQIGIEYQGNKLHPFTSYTAFLKVRTNTGLEVTGELTFDTGRMDTPWTAQWISDNQYTFTEKKISPRPLSFKKSFDVSKEIKSVKVYSTAIGIYELLLNDEKIGNDYFAPGFTSYKNNLQYQIYDITSLLEAENEIIATVAGGWAVGSFGMTRKNRISAKRQALLMEIRIEYQDGTLEIIGTDNTWQVTSKGPYIEGDFYDGEVFDSNINFKEATWHFASLEKVKLHPKIIAAYGEPVRAQEELVPVYLNQIGNEYIYDFGQNFAGIIQLKINGQKGQEVIVKHAEILNKDGSLNIKFLRTAKARIVYKCHEGIQRYSPKFTYMGFRYVSIQGIRPEKIELSARALYSKMDQIGEFSCSNELLNQLQSNIVWSSKSNFIDVPTDCPQRDERMGWTGDIAIFAPTANFNFNTRRFLEKWLYDMAAEQSSTGGIPNVIPAQGFGFPETMPTLAVDFWGDASVLVPWAEYWSRGDKKILEKFYPMMKKYVDACKFWANFLSVGKYRYIWHTHHMLHFGDWVAPDVPQMSQWQKRSPWTATASLKNTSYLLSEIAGILGKTSDKEKYATISQKTAESYSQVLMDGQGKLTKEFQTGYVLPIHFNMLSGHEKKEALKNLVKLIEKANYCIGTGFPGTPYILFALADNGYEDVAYKMLLNTLCPSWLYQVKMGATTIWERWDGLDENGECPISDDGTDLMISYNHYASGAVGDFFYRRIAGIEAIEPGYRKFKIAPLLGGNLEFAKASLVTPYGEIETNWKIENSQFILNATVPVGTECDIYLPSGEHHQVKSGQYEFQEEMKILSFTGNF